MMSMIVAAVPKIVGTAVAAVVILIGVCRRCSACQRGRER